jgi:methyl acetate hydrolase
VIAVAEDIDTLQAEAVERGVTAGVYTMVADRDAIVYSGGAGTRDGVAPWGEDTIAVLASMTKSVIAVAALQLVDQGAIGLDDSIGDVLPELAAPKVLEGYDGDVPRLRPARSPVTLRRLLSHTSGFGYPFLCEDLARYHKASETPSSVASRLSTFDDSPLIHDPGTAFSYGTGLDWTALAITRITGTDLDTHLRECIFAPLGMADTALRVTDRGRLAAMHARRPDGLVVIPFEIARKPGVRSGGNGLYGSPRDYLTFLRMIMAGGTLDGTTILAAETLAEALRSHSGPVGRMASVNPAVSHDIELLPGTPVSWSLLGMRNEELTAQGRPVGTLAWAGGANCYYWADTSTGSATAAVLFTQLIPFADPDLLDLFAAVEQAIRSGSHRGCSLGAVRPVC